MEAAGLCSTEERTHRMSADVTPSWRALFAKSGLYRSDVLCAAFRLHLQARDEGGNRAPRENPRVLNGESYPLSNHVPPLGGELWGAFEGVKRAIWGAVGHFGTLQTFSGSLKWREVARDELLKCGGVARAARTFEIAYVRFEAEYSKDLQKIEKKSRCFLEDLVKAERKLHDEEIRFRRCDAY